MMVRFVVACCLAAGISVIGASPALADPPYSSCKDAAADGAYDMTPDDPGYSPKLDRDGDGIACES